LTWKPHSSPGGPGSPSGGWRRIPGAGKTLLCAYSIESYLAAQPGAFDNGEAGYRIYQAFREWAGVSVFVTDSPVVEVSGLNGDARGYAVGANHSGQATQVLLSSLLPLKSG
jgi:hypothetical protein